MGIGWGGRLLASEFTHWSESGNGVARPVLFCYGESGVGKTCIKYGLQLPSENVGEAK